MILTSLVGRTALLTIALRYSKSILVDSPKTLASFSRIANPDGVTSSISGNVKLFLDVE
jgi:hypothetical protein